MGNQRRERFVRIGEARTNKLIQMIRLLGNCSNKSAYEYSSDEVRKIFSTIEKELRSAKAKFSDNDEDRFKLK